jgi:hypothetical protein
METQPDSQPAQYQEAKIETKAAFPAPILTPEQWSQVKDACVAGMSYQDAARIFKTSYDAIRQRSCRENWLTPLKIENMKRELAVTEKEKLSQEAGKAEKPVLLASQAVAETLESHRSQTLLGLAKTLKNAINSPEAQSIIPENVSELVQLGGLALKLYGIEQQNSVQVNIVTDGSADFGGDDFPVIEIED